MHHIQPSNWDLSSKKCLTACAESHWSFCRSPSCSEGLGNCHFDPGCCTTTRIQRDCKRGSHHNSFRVHRLSPLAGLEPAAESVALEPVESVASEKVESVASVAELGSVHHCPAP